MSQKQSRRSISVSGELYEVLKMRAEEAKSSQSAMVEDAMREVVGLPPRSLRRSKPVLGAKLKVEVRDPKPVVSKAPADMDKADLMRRHAAREVENRAAMIKESAEKKRLADEARAKADTAGGIFTF